MALFMRLKGKQVRNLYDLVTVSREYGSVCISMITGKLGRENHMLIASQETCLLSGTGTLDSRSRVIGRTVF